ncbi:putative DNA-binding domain-containing protein [Dongia sp.]|uniref:HvfC/BufC family peptide modification chaperone n=1 Tax=Dongia sp. TaxID=1977262 RepID=UPI0035B06CB0
MMQLPVLLAAFQAYLQRKSSDMLCHVRGNERLPAADLLEVYRRGYGLRLVEALGNDFPGLRGLLGEDDFANVARDYVATHPSRHPSLRWLGSGLADFLADHGSVLSADMARFDWAVALAFDAPDQSTASLSDLFSLPAETWETFGLRFADCVSDLTADSSIAALRHALLRSESDLPPATGYEMSWLVWRQGEDVQYRPLPEDEAQAFAFMRAGGSFGNMCSLLASTCNESEPSRRGAEILQDWLSRGLVAEIPPLAPELRPAAVPA